MESNTQCPRMKRIQTLSTSSLGVLHVVALLFAGRTGAAEEPPAEEQQRRRGPAVVERRPQLPPLSVVQDGAVEIANDGVGGPADGSQHQEACNDEGNARGDGHLGLLPFVSDKVGALAAGHAQKDPKTPMTKAITTSARAMMTSTDDEAPQEADGGQDQAQNLSPNRHHARCCERSEDSERERGEGRDPPQQVCL